MKITLKQIRVFVLTAKYGNVSMAADEIAISQAAASMSLSQLESMLNKTLFRREGKKLILNSTGKKILPKANSILESVMQLEQSITHKNQHSGDLHIGASTTIANTILPKVLNIFTHKYPNINITLTAANTESCIHQLLNYHIDIALVEGVSLTPEIEFEPWLTDRLSIFCHPKHKLAKKKQVKPKDLEKQLWLLREKTSGTRQVLESALLSSPIEIEKIMVMNSSTAIKNFVIENTSALACLSSHLICEELAQNKLIELKISSWNLIRNFYHANSKHKTYSELSKLFLKELLSKR